MWLNVIRQENSITHKKSNERDIWYIVMGLFPLLFPSINYPHLLFSAFSSIPFLPCFSVPPSICSITILRLSITLLPSATAYSRSLRVSITAMLMGSSTGIWRFVWPQPWLQSWVCTTGGNSQKHLVTPLTVLTLCIHTLCFCFFFSQSVWWNKTEIDNCFLIWEGKYHHKDYSIPPCRALSN